MSSIVRIDTKFQRDEMCGCFLIQHNKAYTLIEIGSTISVPAILAYLDENHIKREDVKNILITHVHLDHSGGTDLILQSLPNAKVYTHKSGVPHIIDPKSKLVPGAIEVYGVEVFNKDYPNIQNAPEGRVIGCEDGQIIDEVFQFFEAHGHAFHHCMWYYLPEKVLFTGDGMGFGFTELNMCPLLCTSPTQFDAGAWKSTIEKVKQIGPERLQPTHFHTFTEPHKVYESVLRQLDKYNELINSVNNKDDLKQGFLNIITDELKQFGLGESNQQKAYDLTFGDISVDGLWFRVQRRLQKGAKK